MRVGVFAVALVLMGAGCRSTERPEGAARPDPETTKGGWTSDAARETPPATNAASAAVVLPASGRVHSVNAGRRFVVIDYTLGGMPELQSVLGVYRSGQKVGEVRLSGPERNGFVAADVVDGYLQVDDEVRVY